MAEIMLSNRIYMINRWIIIFLAGVLFTFNSAVAQEKIVERQQMKSVKIYFRLGSKVIDESYMGNKETLEKFASEVNMYCSDSTARFRRIRIVASASPEGGKVFNENLAKARAEAITNWINSKISRNIGYDVESTGIDWDMLVELVTDASGVPFKEEVLEIITETPEIEQNNGVVVNLRYNKLRKLQNGVPYYWISRNLFPRMRYASARAEFWWEVEPKLIITSESPMKFTADGADGLITFKKTHSDPTLPKVESLASWVTVVSTTDGGISFKVAPNSLAKSRSTNIELQYFGKKYSVDIQQEAAEPVMTITSDTIIYYPAIGGDGKIMFAKNITDQTVPDVNTSASWITSLAAGKEDISYHVVPNKEAEPRSETIEVSCYGNKHRVTIVQDGAKPYYMALKSNLLYDAVAIPNVGVEFYLGKKMSIAGNWYYSWWKDDVEHWYHRYYGGDLALRYWFGKRAQQKPLTGHHAGIYGQILTYDFEFGERGILADRWSWAAGVEYGYSLPVSRRLNFDFTVGVGYHWGEFKEYLPIDGHYVWQATKNRRYVGPTKVEVSLVWLLGRGNYNNNKGKRK